MIARRGAAALILAGLATPAAAQRPSTVTMLCSQAAGIVSARGALVLGTGGQTFDRFVRDRSFCEPTEITSRAFVPTRDNPDCFIGYRCKEPGRDLFGDDE
ncbi:hypothetical protein [Methylobacterium oryzisoli]|uniref:hypothetical protein n=1 Tax=Methylobacterium oryzisoli TaxID=3385502 RepID=UPI0038923D98